MFAHSLTRVTFIHRKTNYFCCLQSSRVISALSLYEYTCKIMFWAHSTHHFLEKKSIFCILLPPHSFSASLLAGPSLDFTQNQITCRHSSPRCVTRCVFPDSPVNVLLCRDEPAPGFSQFTTSTDSRVSACRPGVEGEEGRVV